MAPEQGGTFPETAELECHSRISAGDRHKSVAALQPSIWEYAEELPTIQRFPEN